MREEQIKILEQRRGEIALDPERIAEYNALTDAISFIRDTSEMLEAANLVQFPKYEGYPSGVASVPTIRKVAPASYSVALIRDGKCVTEIVEGSALDAYRAVKEKR